MAPGSRFHGACVVLAACLLVGCEYLAGTEERTLAGTADAGQTGPDASCTAAGLVAWPDSSTAFCSNGSASVPCDGATKPIGQDGLYRIDVPTYTKITVAKGMSALRDEITGLQWLKDDSDVKTWDDARTSCEKLGDGFRLPTRRELATLLDYGKTSPAIDSAFTTNVSNNEWFWTASGPGPDVAWAVGFNEGAVTMLPRTSGARSRCVLAAATGSCLTPEVDGETVRDARTGLVWQRQPSPNDSTWGDALSQCEALVLAGKGDWRLPSAKEMGSLVEGDAPGMALDPDLFLDGVGRFWSSTPSPARPDHAFFLDGVSGVVQSQSVTLAGRVRCVR
jgi:hypothetical protein